MHSSPAQLPNYSMLIAHLQDKHDELKQQAAPPRVGELVRWKRGLRQNPLLGETALAVVVELPEEPWEPQDAAAVEPQYSVPLNVVLGTFGEIGEFITLRANVQHLESCDSDSGRVASVLRLAAADFLQMHALKVGQVVTWKPFCEPLNAAPHARVAIVLEKLDAPLRLDEDPEEIKFDKMISHAVAIEDDNCGFRVVWEDARVLQPYVAGAEVAGVASGDFMEVDVEPQPEWEGESVAARLKERFAALNRSAMLKPGQLVRWKAGLSNGMLPPDDGLAIVMSMLEREFYDEDAPVACETWRAPYTVALGCMGEDGHFEIFRYDARRFELAISANGDESAFLRRAYDSYQKEQNFECGEVLEWKRGLGDPRASGAGGLVIVMKVMDAESVRIAVNDSLLSGNQLLVGLRYNGQLGMMMVDGARLRPASRAADKEVAAWLRLRYVEYTEKIQIVQGDFCEWKDGMAPPIYADQKMYAVVLQYPLSDVLEERVPWTYDFSPESFALIGVVDDYGDLMVSQVEARRLQRTMSYSDEAEALQAYYDQFSHPRQLKPGQGVVWVEGMESESDCICSMDSPAVVLELVDPPMLPKNSGIFRDASGARGDVLLGGRDEYGDFVVVHADSRRLRPHPSQHGEAVRAVRGLRRRLHRKSVIRPGMIVAWMDNLGALEQFPAGMPGLVLEVYKQPRIHSREWAYMGWSQCSYRWNALVGVMHGNNFVRVYCDSRRLEPFDPSIHGQILKRRVEEGGRRHGAFIGTSDEFGDDEMPF